MPANEFEKQVMQKLEDLQIRPSPEVWTEVEKQIRKEKKRRRIIFWWVLPCLLTAGGITWYITRQAQPAELSEQGIKQIQKESVPFLIPDNNNDPHVATENKTGSATVAIGKSNHKELPDIQFTLKKKEPLSNSRKPAELLMDNKELPQRHTEIPLSSNEDFATNNNPPGPVEKKSSDANSVINESKPPLQEKIAQGPPAVNGEDSVNNGSDSIKIVHSEGREMSEPPIKNEKKKNNPGKSKWGLELKLTAGISGRVKGLPSLGSQKALSNSSLSGGLPSGPFIYTYPAEPGSGFAWEAGIHAIRKMTKKTSFSIGLAYSSLSTSQEIGGLVDSSRVIQNASYSTPVRTYYQSGKYTNYINHYNYIQLPVSLQWQVNKGRKIPLTWENGFALGWLSGSNALQYSERTNVFYRDNELLNNIQLSFQSGFQVKLFNSSNHPVTTGFSLNYNLTPLDKVYSNDRNHLFSMGWRLGCLLKK